MPSRCLAQDMEKTCRAYGLAGRSGLLLRQLSEPLLQALVQTPAPPQTRGPAQRAARAFEREQHQSAERPLWMPAQPLRSDPHLIGQRQWRSQHSGLVRQRDAQFGAADQQLLLSAGEVVTLLAIHGAPINPWC